MSKKDLERSKAPGGAHHFLARLIGEWEGTAKTWFEPGKLADESPWSGSFRPILDGLFVAHEYTGSIQEKPLSGMAVHGYYVAFKKFMISWIDTFHMGTGILLSEGSSEVNDNSFSVSGIYSDSPGDPPWGWRTTVEIPGPDEIVITHFNITPDGQEAKAVEILYTRKKHTS